MKASNRRDFCRTILGGAAASLAFRSSRAFAQDTTPAIAVTKLTESFSLITGAGANILLLNTLDGVLMVDGGTPERSADVLKVVAEQTGGRPVQVLFNTHWHLESTGSNDTLGKTGIKIVAHENTRLWMGTEFHVQWQNRTYKPRPKEARPNSTFYTTAKMTFGKEEVQYGHLGQAHTDGDIYVFFPGPNILVTGDVFTVGSYPILDWSTGGWIGGMSEAHRLLVELTNEQTRIIPGAGPVQSQADLKELAAMTSTMRTRFVEMMRKGMSAGDMYRAAPTKDFDAKWGDPRLFIANAYPGLWNHVRELGGIV